MVRRYGIIPLFEVATVVGLLATVLVTYFVVVRTGRPETPLSPETIAVLLVANLVPAMALMVMVARRLAIRRAALSEVGGKGRLHVRLVALFSLIASVPTLLVVIFASMLFQSGVKFWFSDQAQDRARQRRECFTDLRAGASGTGQARRSGHGRGRRRSHQPVRHRKRGVSGRFPLSDGSKAAHRNRRPGARIPKARSAAEIEVNFDDRPLARRFPIADTAIDDGGRDPHGRDRRSYRGDRQA